jgi:hypothetical protein
MCNTILKSKLFYLFLCSLIFLQILKVRLRRPLEWVFSRLDELLGHVTGADRPALHQAIWAELAEEMNNIR